MRVMTLDGRLTTVNLAGFLDLESSSGPLAAGRVVNFIPGPDGVVPTRDYQAVYKTNPWLFATIRLKANGLARMPHKVYRYTDDEGDRVRIRPRGSGGDEVERRARSLAQSLAHPGNRVSAPALRRSTTLDANVWGPGVWSIERDRYGDYTGFRRIPYRRVAVDKIAGVVRYWDVTKPEVKYLADDIVHFGLGSDCDEFNPSSPIAALPYTLALYDAVERHLVAFFKNSARPAGHYEVQPGTGKAVRQAVATAIRELYAGPDNAGRVLITSAKWNAHTVNPDHSRVVELAKLAREEMVAVYGMPPPLVGILDRAIMSNVRELRSHYARDVCGPDVALFEGDLDAQLIQQDELLAGEVYIETEMAAVMRPDLEARAATYNDRLNVESLNEVRSTESLPRVDHPDADMPRFPLNTAPVGTPPAEPPLMERTGENDDA